MSGKLKLWHDGYHLVVAVSERQAGLYVADDDEHEWVQVLDEPALGMSVAEYIKLNGKGHHTTWWPGKKEHLYYIQNRGCCGNCLFFWRKGGGYTANVEEAEVFTLEEAKKATNRSLDMFWPKSHIDARAVKHVDMQCVDLGLGIRAHEEKENKNG